MKRVNVLDLTIAQVADIETDPRVGKSMSDWDDAPSEAYLLGRILAAGNGVELETIEGKTLRELQELVELGDDDPETDPQKPT